jgi:hypothetical protein
LLAVVVSLFQLDVSGAVAAPVSARFAPVDWLESEAGLDGPPLNIFEKKPDTFPGIEVTFWTKDGPDAASAGGAGCGAEADCPHPKKPATPEDAGFASELITAGFAAD